MKRLFITVICCLVLGCVQFSPSPSSDQGHLYFERADVHSLIAYDPVSMAKDDLGKGIPRFLAVAGFNLVVPGIDTDLCSAFPIHVYIIGGTSDDGPMHLGLQARNFALQYNLTVRDQLIKAGTFQRFLECQEPKTLKPKAPTK